MLKRSGTNVTPAALTALLILTVMGSGAQVDASSTLQQPDRFLSPPYYGTTSVTSVFDHRFPIPNDGNVDVLH